MFFCCASFPYLFHKKNKNCQPFFVFFSFFCLHTKPKTNLDSLAVTSVAIHSDCVHTSYIPHRKTVYSHPPRLDGRLDPASQPASHRPAKSAGGLTLTYCCLLIYSAGLYWPSSRGKPSRAHTRPPPRHTVQRGFLYLIQTNK